MPYVPLDWVDNSTPLNAANMDHLEAGVAGAIPKDLVDAKGDLLGASAADTPARLPVGTNGQLLTADAAQALGIKWVDPPAEVPPTTGHEGQWLRVDGTGALAWYDAPYLSSNVLQVKGDLITATDGGIPATLARGANGEILVADSTTAYGLKWSMPTSELAVATVTSPVAITATTDATGDTVISASFTSDGAPVLIQFFCPRAQLGTGAGAALIISLWESTTQIARISNTINNGEATGNLVLPVSAFYRHTPTAGAHTFTIKAHTVIASALLSAGSGGAGTIGPIMMRIQRT